MEYWFFKLNHPGGALLVDWIARRRQSEGEVRISIHSPVAREVLFVDHRAILEHGPAELNLARTSWSRGDVRWDLTLRPSPALIRPRILPAEILRFFDMSMTSAPTVSFRGWIEHRSARYPVDGSAGALSHYWGRALPREWWWISANQFEEGDVSLECTVLRSHLLGTPLHVPLGYLYYRNGPSEDLLIAPPARLRVSGTPESFEIRARSNRGKTISLRATGREYAALGDGIINTLTGDLEIWEADRLAARARGTAGLERRAATVPGPAGNPPVRPTQTGT